MFRRRPSPQRAALTVMASAAFLCLLFASAKDESTGRMIFDWRPEIEPLLLMAGLALLALAGRRLSAPLRWIVAALVVAVALLQFADAVVLGVFDRGLDLYFDLPHVPKMVALLYDAAGPWRGGAIIAAGVLLSAGLVALTERALAASEQVLRPPHHASLCLGIIAAVLIVAPIAGLHAGVMPLAQHTLPVLADQAQHIYRDYAVMHGDDPRYAAALSAPQPAPGALPGLKRRDVALIFIESYGTLALDDRRFSPAVLPALDEFAAAVQQAGYHLASSRITSPTFGGGSWLAHDTIDSGLRLDPLLGRLVTKSERHSLPGYMKTAGYRTVDVAPGIKTPEPDHGFWSFDRSYYGDDLGYRGPAFGWFRIPDQYTLRRFDDTEAAPGHPPLFAQIVLVSSHTPFSPLPPYVADWGGDLDHGLGQAAGDHAVARPDWSHLEGAYAASIVYDLKTLAGWLQRRPGDGLVIILGDHQPPGFASGAAQPWTVPIHVLSRDPEMIRPFLAQGYAEGAEPPRKEATRGMESFLGDFLAAYAQPSSVASAPASNTEHKGE